MVVLAAMLAGHVSTSWHASPDSALYMGLARSLIAGDGYTFNYAPHAMVPPLFPLIVAGEMKLFGEFYLALNIGQAVFALACVPVAFALLRRGFGDDLAFVGTAMFALSHVLWRYSSMVITDVPFAFFAMLAMLAGMWAAGARKWLWAKAAAAGLLLGACGLIRANGLVLLAAVAPAIWLGWAARRRIVRAAGVALVSVLALEPAALWKAYVATTSSEASSTYYDVSVLAKPAAQMVRAMAVNLFVDLPREMSNMLIGVSDIPIVLNWLLPLAVLVGCVICVRRRSVVLPVAIIATFCVMALVPEAKSRYLLFLLPGLYALAIVGVTAVVRRLAGGLRASRVDSQRIIAIAVIVPLLCNVGHNLTKLYQWRGDSVPYGHRIGKRQGWFEASAYILAHNPPAEDGGRPGAVILARNHSVVHYLSLAKTVPMKYGGDIESV
ncbi:MAG: glycosyltransferase family 39 protein, partial [Phycisphaerae bacterium]|nr:glycosyltransferase family 39 protein [Phycisphaerae bacterium]